MRMPDSPSCGKYQVHILTALCSDIVAFPLYFRTHVLWAGMELLGISNSLGALKRFGQFISGAFDAVQHPFRLDSIIERHPLSEILVRFPSAYASRSSELFDSASAAP